MFNSRNIQIRPASSFDFREILIIDKLTESESNWNEAHLQRFLDLKKNIHNCFFSLTENNLTTSPTIIGFCLSRIIFQEAELLKIAVHPDWQRKGLGDKLLKSSIDVWQKFEFEKGFLEVRESNIPAINLYKKIGFHEQGIRKGYFLNNENAITMMLNKNY